eukprot:TRINITY_DN9572_c0_g1_i1.p1 TRINITY_DN9572_c0_g1~~TRINITY_DN9572_c0_g1_i1.p1  ORF type:complete len:241 (-),score=39.24 TRINITY_DN9572_c0_g1_i1:173-835(-)
MPLLPVIGNHDSGGYLRSVEEVKFYFDYFAVEKGKPSVAYRSTSFADTTIVAIDSDFQSSFLGTQRHWVEKKLVNNNQSMTFTAYHFPMFPRLQRQFDGKREKKLREAYTDLFFDQGVAIAFEFHRHAYKRTKGLGPDGSPTLPPSSTSTDSGVVYIGDGCMGANESYDSPDTMPYMEKEEATSHYLLVTVNGSQVVSEAIGLDGQVFDRFEGQSRSRTR